MSEPATRSKDLAIIVTLSITLITWIVGAVWFASGMSTRMADLERRMSIVETQTPTKLDAIQGAITDVQVKLATLQEQIAGIKAPKAPGG